MVGVPVALKANSKSIDVLEYWRTKLALPPVELVLPADLVRTIDQEYIVGKVSQSLPEEFSAIAVEDRQRILLKLLTAWKILLWQLSGNPDTVTLVSGWVGSNTGTELLPIRTLIDSQATVDEVLRLTEGALCEAYENQDISGKALHDLVGHSVRTAFQFNPVDGQEEIGISPKNLSFSLKVREKNIFDFDFEYDASLFSEKIIHAWIKNYFRLLGGILASPSQSLSTLIMTDHETQKTVLPTVESVPALIGHAFAAMPEGPAAAFYGLTYSRARLTDKSDRLASWLIRHGVSSGALVGIYMDRSMEMLVAVLAVMKAGAAYIPLDPKFPAKRLEQIIEETEFPILLTLSRHMDDLPKFGGTVLSVDGKAAELAKEPHQPLPKISQEMCAYVIFTSGSTGTPKGVEVTHGSVLNLLTDLQQRLEIGAEDRLLAVTTLAFDISVLELLLPLVCGGTVIIATQADASDGLRLMELLDESQITVLQATPFTWKMLLELGFEPPPGFKMLCGGEAWSASMGEKLLATDGRLWNMYGPTETTVWSSVTEVHRGATRITIGPPIANTRFYVLGENLQTLPSGASGELFIAGIGVARGYFNRPELTAEKFLPDPFVAGERMYRTGDEVRQHHDGTIEFLGRLDQQIKLRGFRIELGEIESAMIQLPQVSDAVVVQCKDSAGEDMLAGYYTAQSKVPSSQVRESLQGSLPFYMVPKILEQLEAFPLTPNGKTDRRALSELVKNIDSSEQDKVLAESELSGASVEQQMLAIWLKIFEGVKIKNDSNFFDIGGDSLSLVRLQSLVTRQFGVHLTMTDITRHPTFGMLTFCVDDMRSKESPATIRPTNPRVLPVNTAEAGRPIFLLPQMMIFWPLAEELGEHQTVFAIQLLDEDVPASMESATFEELAVLYCKLIREVQPEGPYRLGGWCLWALVSYEIARLLEDQGEEVELLMIMDAWAPGHWTRQSPIRKMLMNWAYSLHRLRWMSNRLRYGSMEKRKRDILRRLRAIATSTSVLPRGMRPETPARESSRIEKLVSDAVNSYKPIPIKGTVAVFKGEQQATSPLIGEDLGWSQLLGRKVSVDTLPGNHSEIFDLPGARIMASRVRKIINPT